MPSKTRSQQAKASRSKGKRGERKLGLRLKKWWGADFHRTPASGGLRWGERHEVRGDLVCEDTFFPFVIEEKNREAWELELFLTGKGPIFTWWKQVWRDSIEIHRIPLLFIDKNYSPGYVIFKPRLLKGLMKEAKPKHYMVTTSADTGMLYLVERELFLNMVSVERCQEVGLYV